MIKKKNTSESKVLIIGVGNILLRDEGLGIYAIEKLTRMNLPDHIVLAEAGTDIFKILTIEGIFEKIIIIDVIRVRKRPGSIYKFLLEDIQIESEAKSAHQIQIVDALKLIKQVDKRFEDVEVMIIGIEPECIELGTGLTNIVNSKLDLLLDKVLEESKNARSISGAEYN